MEKKIKLQIKNRFTGYVIFEYESADNTMRKTVEEAVRADASLRGANLRGADLCGADLCGANLCDANLCGANLGDADLCGADLRDADLGDADLCGANLGDADLRDANLGGANLRGANLCDADLRGANLCDANLRDANLCGANLRGADLRADTSLCGADLRDADLGGANLRGVVIGYNDIAKGYGDQSAVLNKFKEKFGVDITKFYENHDAFSSHWGAFWKNLIIIRDWKLVEKEQKTATVDLSDDVKAALKAFIGVHKVKKLTYEIYGPNCYFTAYNDENDFDIELPGHIDGLKDMKDYTLKELGIEEGDK